jgi:hypothetical protein
MATKIEHVDKTDCVCGQCEPAIIDGMTIGQRMSGNPACEFPACIILGEMCRWADQPCFDIRAYHRSNSE